MNTRTLILAMVVATAPLANANLIVNGDFSSGNLGVTSTHSFVSYATAITTPGGPGNMWGEGTYTVGTDSNAVHSSWVSMGSNSNPMMIVNGQTSANVVWSQSILPIVTGLHTFSFDLADIYSANTANLEAIWTPTVGIGGSLGMAQSSAAVGTFQNFSFNFSGVSGVSGMLSLVNHELNANGNDFALDNLSAEPVPEPATMAVLGLGAVAALRRKRAQK